MALTEKQKKFVEEYVRDLNATRAYEATFGGEKVERLILSKLKKGVILWEVN